MENIWNLSKNNLIVKNINNQDTKYSEYEQQQKPMRNTSVWMLNVKKIDKCQCANSRPTQYALATPIYWSNANFTI